MSEDTTNAITSDSDSDVATKPAVAATEQQEATSDVTSAVTETTMSDVTSGANNALEQAQALPPQPLAAVEKMEVEVDFEVGRVTLAVSSLANIAQGAVIDIGAVALDNVTAKSGGVAFAHGEFVELGGRVGFRITRLFGEQEKL